MKTKDSIKTATDWLEEMQQWTEGQIVGAANDANATWAQRAAARRLIAALSDRRTNDGQITGGDDFYKITGTGK